MVGWISCYTYVFYKLSIAYIPQWIESFSKKDYLELEADEVLKALKIHVLV